MKRTRWIMVAISVLSVVVAVAIPGYQTRLIAFGGVLIAWAGFGLMTEPGTQSNGPTRRSHRDRARRTAITAREA